VWEPKVPAPLDVVLYVYYIVVCSKHLHVSDVANLCLHLPILQGVFVLFQASEFHHVWSNGSIAQDPYRCRCFHLHYLVLITLLQPLLRRFSPVYITEHTPKYNSIEKCMKLPFQWVLIYLNRSPNEGFMTVLSQLLHAVQKIQNVQPSVIRPYPLVGTSDWLDSWFFENITSWSF
jgi:hypothetical protein